MEKDLTEKLFEELKKQGIYEQEDTIEDEDENDEEDNNDDDDDDDEENNNDDTCSTVNIKHIIVVINKRLYRRNRPRPWHFDLETMLNPPWWRP